jgi:uncharacterized protein YegL
MPKLKDLGKDLEKMTVDGGGSFQFSGVRIQDLGATEYTLVTIATDRSGSVGGFNTQLLEAIKTVVEACKKSPRAENLMLRLLTFNQGLEEVHGFRLLSTIDPADYVEPVCNGMTALFDATYSGIGATLTYAKKLIDQDFMANGIVFIITDGEDNESSTTPGMIADLVNRSKVGEDIESLITILIGVNTANNGVAASLDKFSNDAQLTQYVDVGSITPQKLAKLATFVSKSVSSQSQALGTGGPSQPLVF